MMDSLYYLSPDVKIECFDKGALILNLNSLIIVEINSVARDILLLMDGKTGIEEISKRIAEEYEIEYTLALEDTEELYHHLVEKGILISKEIPTRKEDKQ